MPDEATHLGLLKLFYLVDTDHDNRVSFEELKAGFKMFGFNEEQFCRFMKKYDGDKDGYLNLTEYKAAFGIPEDLKHETHHVSSTDIRNPVSQCKITKNMSKGALLALFEKLDLNKDRKISHKELEKGMLQLGATEHDVESLMSFLDMDDDGMISEKEYHIALSMSLDPVLDWQRIFEQLDCDRSGDISVAELKVVFDRIGMPIMSSGIMEWIKQYDKNCDGKLDYQEFLSFVGKQRNMAKQLKAKQ